MRLLQLTIANCQLAGVLGRCAGNECYAHPYPMERGTAAVSIPVHEKVLKVTANVGFWLWAIIGGYALGASADFWLGFRVCFFSPRSIPML